MALIQIRKPTSPLTPNAEQGKPTKTKTGWTVEGFRTEDDVYVERARRGSEEKWFLLDYVD